MTRGGSMELQSHTHAIASSTISAVTPGQRATMATERMAPVFSWRSVLALGVITTGLYLLYEQKRKEIEARTSSLCVCAHVPLCAWACVRVCACGHSKAPIHAGNPKEATAGVPLIGGPFTLVRTALISLALSLALVQPHA